VAKKELAEAHASQKEAGEVETDSEAEPPSEKVTDVVGEKQYAPLVEMMTEWVNGAPYGRNGLKSETALLKLVKNLKIGFDKLILASKRLFRFNQPLLANSSKCKHIFTSSSSSFWL